MAKQKNQPIKTGPFGPIYTQFEGKPKEAIKHLMMMKDGECPKALYREETGYVDIVWGDKKFGLCHIVDEHKDEFKQLGFEVEDFIPIVFAFGKYTESKQENKIRLIGEEFMLIVKTKWNDENKRFVMSTFDLRPISRKNPKRAKRLQKKGK